MKLADYSGYETNLQLTQHCKSPILQFQNRKQELENKSLTCFLSFVLSPVSLPPRALHAEASQREVQMRVSGEN